MVEMSLIIGCGVIGLSCAWRAATAGHAVTLLDPAPMTGASWVAGGMLAPVTEAWPGEEELLAMGVAAVAAWPGFAAELTAAAGRPVGLRSEGTVVVATGTGDRAELDTLAGYLAKLGRDVERLNGRELRRLEPALGPDVRGGLSVPGDLAVDNRMLLEALRIAAERAGVRFVATAVREIVDDGERVTGVRTDGGDIAAEQVLICAGAHSAMLHPALDGLVRPVKGEILRLAHRAGAFPPPTRTVRALVDGRPVYAVPRDGGGLVIGATQYETGFDAETQGGSAASLRSNAIGARAVVTVGGVRDLLRDAERVLPGIAEYALVESAAGVRPGTPDNLPLIGAIGPHGLLVATGHHRNGMLLAPVTADAVLALLDGAVVADEVLAAAPERMSRRTTCT